MKRILLRAALFALPVSILLPFMDRYPFHPGSVFARIVICLVRSFLRSR